MANQLLRQHPDVCPKTNQLHSFNTRDTYARGMGYRAQFAAYDGERAVGESTPIDRLYVTLRGARIRSLAAD